MANIKSIDVIAEKWTRVTPGRSADYAAGVAAPRTDWATATANAESAYGQGVQQAVSRKAFSKGVKAAGTAKWQQKTTDKGVPRWSQGITMSGNDYANGFGPYAQVIASTTLPPRYPAGDPRNIDRVAAIAKALRDKKIGGGA